MDEDYYPKMDDDAAPDKAGDGEEADEGETTLVPKSMFGGKDYQPGDKCTFEIMHDHGDEVEVRHVSDQSDEKHESEMDKAAGRLGAMNE